ncbi:MAG: hypothetical protein WA322_08685 [Pseudolabrys sp.]
MGPTPGAELHLRAERAEQQVADLKAALENIKSERDRWRTIAERRSLPDQPGGNEALSLSDVRFTPESRHSADEL